MPRFFFDILVNDRCARDDEGVELLDSFAVQREALMALPTITKELALKSEQQQVYAVHVRGDDGSPVYSATVTFTAVKIGVGGSATR